MLLSDRLLVVARVGLVSYCQGFSSFGLASFYYWWVLLYGSVIRWPVIYLGVWHIQAYFLEV